LTLLAKGQVDRVVVIRSAVPTREQGFIPGNLDEKSEPYMLPYQDMVDTLTNDKKSFNDLLSSKLVEFPTTSFLRGVTFDNAFILVDEFQNMSGHELHTVLTRVGTGTHLCLVGDSDQSDLTGREAQEHKKELTIVKAMECVQSFTFSIADIVRSDFVKSYYKSRRAFIVAQTSE
jgi:predicted ribonuclease YlaK